MQNLNTSIHQEKLPKYRKQSLPARNDAAAYIETARFVFSKSRHLSIGALLIGVLLFMVLTAPVLSTVPPDKVQPDLRLQAPTLETPFGTDNLGRDMFSRVLYGSRIALLMSLLTVTISAIPGITLGLLSGYCHGWVDQIFSRLMDVWMSLPGLLLAIVLLARLGPSLFTTIIALGIAGVPSFYRLARNCALSITQMPYIEAAFSIGAGHGRVLLRHILPNMVSPFIILATMRLGTILLAGAGLSFIGLGAQPPKPEWGTLLASGRNYLDTAWWLAVFPGLAITLTTMGFNLLGDGLRDVLAPRTR